MTNKTFKPSIPSYASVSDAKMILDELILELTVFDTETNKELIKLLEDKKAEIDSRYSR